MCDGDLGPLITAFAFGPNAEEFGTDILQKIKMAKRTLSEIDIITLLSQRYRSESSSRDN